MNLRAVQAIYVFEMARTGRTLMQSILSPVLSTSLYFVVFGAAIGSRITEIEGVQYGAFIVPGLIMVLLLTQSVMNASFGIYFPKFVGTIYEILSAPVSAFEIVLGYVGAAATKSMILGLIVLYAQAMSFSELATMIPKAGSMNEYVRAGLGPFFATVTVFVGYFAVVIFPGSSEAFLSSAILSDDAFLGAPGDFKLWVIVIVTAIAILNLLGIRAFAAVEVPLTFLLAASLVIFGLAGLAGVGDTVSGALPSIPWDTSLLISLIALATFTFVGVEYTCPLAEELRRPERDIPWGMFIGLTLVAVPMFLWGAAATRYLPLDQLGDPEQITNMNVAIAIFGDAGKWWMWYGVAMALGMYTHLTMGFVAAGHGLVFLWLVFSRKREAGAWPENSAKVFWGLVGLFLGKL